MTEITFKELKLKSKTKLNHEPVKLAILSDTTSQFLSIAIKGYGVLKNLNFEIFLGPHGQIEQLLANPNSDLLRFKPDYILISLSSLNLQQNFYQIEHTDNRNSFSVNTIQRIKSLNTQINKQLITKIVYFNFPEINDGIYGHYANKLTSSFLHQTRKLNVEIAELAATTNNLHIIDLASILNLHGRINAVDSKLFINAGLEFNLNLLPNIAKEVVTLINTQQGNIKKCLILDLDNTLWGGIIGDDGINGIQLGELGVGKAFILFQTWVKELKRRGVLLAICSKNDEKIAKEPFVNHPDMVLKLDDIAIFIANWKSKVDNIKIIQSVLNIGFDSMVFLDDNPAEREWVKNQLPDIMVPNLPEDPAEYLPFVQSKNLFETGNISAQDDAKRTQQYQQETKRQIHKEEFGTYKDYLLSLKMEGSIVPINEFNLPRAAQLSQRSNQFNFRTIRYSEEDLTIISNDKNCFSFCLHLKDKFGDYGLISLAILRKNAHTLFIENWIMSCRVFNREVEIFMLNAMIKLAKNNKAEYLVGEYISTKKNGIISNFFETNSFEKINNRWWLNLSKHEPLKETPIEQQLINISTDGIPK